MKTTNPQINMIDFAQISINILCHPKIFSLRDIFFIN